MERLQDSPPLTRFVVEKNKMTTTRVLPKLFKPYQGKVSVFQTDTWPRERVEECGVTVARERGKKLHGWAILTTRDVPERPDLGSGLTVDYDNTPPGHANITGWPIEPEDILNWQKELAKHSRPFRLPQPLE